MDVGIQGHGDDPAAEKDGRDGQHVVREQRRNIRYQWHMFTLTRGLDCYATPWEG